MHAGARPLRLDGGGADGGGPVRLVQAAGGALQHETLFYLDDLLVENLGNHDVQVEEPRPRLIPDEENILAGRGAINIVSRRQKARPEVS